MPGGATLVEFIGAGWLSIGACMRVVLMTAAVGPALERVGRTGVGGGREREEERKGDEVEYRNERGEVERHQ